MWQSFYDARVTRKAWDEEAHPRHQKGTEQGGRFAPKDDAALIAGRFENADRYRRKDDPTESQYESWEAAARASGFGKLNGEILANALRVLHVGPKMKRLVMDRAKEIHDIVTGGSQEKVSFETFARLKGELPFILNLKMASLAGLGVVFREPWLQNERAWNTYAARLSKAWNEAEHPRQPAGSDKGGEFAPKGAGGDGIPEAAKRRAGWERRFMRPRVKPSAASGARYVGAAIPESAKQHKGWEKRFYVSRQSAVSNDAAYVGAEIPAWAKQHKGWEKRFARPRKQRV